MGKIENFVSSQLNPELQRVDLTKYEKFRYNFQNNENVLLPHFDELKRRGLPLKKLWVILKDFTVSYTYEGVQYTRVFKKGFMYDKGSVPKILQGILSINNPMANIAFLCHDGDYITQNVPYSLANELMYETMLCVSIQRSESVFLVAENTYLEETKWFQKNWSEEKKKKRAKQYATRKKNIYLVRSKREASLYRFGVATKKGRRVYDSSLGKKAWQNDFIIFNRTVV